MSQREYSTHERHWDHITSYLSIAHKTGNAEYLHERAHGNSLIAAQYAGGLSKDFAYEQRQASP